MDWIKRLNEVIDFVETHLDEEVDVVQLARMSCCSVFQFQRMFSYLANVPLGVYIRRRRMSQAASRLLQPHAKVLDVALQCGYDSPTAFTRAFRQVHGIAPSQVRQAGVTLKSYPPIRFQIIIQGDAEMNYRMVPMESFTVLGMERSFDYDSSFEAIPMFWGEYFEKGYHNTVCGCYGICLDNPLDPAVFRYLIADNCEPDAEIPQGYIKEVIPAHTWAVFSGDGEIPEGLQQLNRRVFNEWLPSQKEYEVAAPMNIEHYFCDGLGTELKYEIWLPVKPKE